MAVILPQAHEHFQNNNNQHILNAHGAEASMTITTKTIMENNNSHNLSMHHPAQQQMCEKWGGAGHPGGRSPTWETGCMLNSSPMVKLQANCRVRYSIFRGFLGLSTNVLDLTRWGMSVSLAHLGPPNCSSLHSLPRNWRRIAYFWRKWQYFWSSPTKV